MISVQKRVSTWMKLKISAVFVAFVSSALAEDLPDENIRSQQETLDIECDGELSTCRSAPIRADSVAVHVLDKISGKVFRSKMSVGQSVRVGRIVMQLNQAFVNNSEDADEVYAHIKVEEENKVMFNNWLFASSPVNLFVHPIYEVRIEF